MAVKQKGIRLSRRLEEVGLSDIVQIRNQVTQLRSSGIKVHPMHMGEPFFNTPEKIKTAAIRAIEQNETLYAPSAGLLSLRQALVEKLARKNQIHVKADEVLVTAGGMQAIFAAFQSVLDPGDDVLIFSPYRTRIRDLITLTQARPLLVPTVTARRHGIATTLEQFSTSKTRAIYYNTPQNPSGTAFNKAEAEEVAAFARRRDLIVIADEAYEDFVYDGPHISIASLPGMGERTISCYTFSKTYAMTGWRAGYAVAREPFMSGMKRIALYSTNGIATPIQHAMIEALNTPDQEITAMRDEYRKRRDLLMKAFSDVGMNCPTPEGAFYAFPHCDKIHKDSRKAAQMLLEKAHIATVPGVVFGAQGEGHLRFGYALSMEELEACIEALHGFFR